MTVPFSQCEETFVRATSSKRIKDTTKNNQNKMARAHFGSNAPESDSSATPSQRDTLFFSPSCHMRLGCGLSSLTNSARVSCFDLEISMDGGMEFGAADPSLSESDIFSLLGPSNSGAIFNTTPKEAMMEHDR